MISLMNDEKEFDYKNPNKVTKLIADTYKVINNNLCDKYKVKCLLSGSTGVTLLISDNKLYCANVGDSECGIVYNNPKNNKPSIQMINKNHLPTNKDEKKRIEASGGVCEPFKLEDGTLYGPLRVWKRGEGAPGLMMTRSFGDSFGHEVGMIAVPDIQVEKLDKSHKAIV